MRNKLFAGSILFLLASLIVTCQCSKKSDKELVREEIEKLAKWAEDKKVNEILAMLDETYRDFEGRDKAATRELLADNFKTFHGIIVNLLGTRITMTPPSEAQVEADVSLSSGAAKVLRKLVDIAVQTFRFSFQLKITPTAWRITSCEWKTVRVDQMFPESVNLFR